MDALQEMRRRHVGHVERRILAQKHDIPVREVLDAGGGKPVVISGLVLDRQRMPAREQLPAVEGEVGRRVIEYLVPAPLRFEQDRERRIAADIDPLDRVHLAGDAEGHGGPGFVRKID